MDSNTFYETLPALIFVALLCLVWAAVRHHRRTRVDVPLEPLPVPVYTGPFAFFRRHFHGDYPLARSYWVNTLLLTLFAPVLGFSLMTAFGNDLPARYGSAAFLLITAVGLGLWCWAVIGTWASANKHVRRGGRAGWATMAKLVIVLGLFKNFGDLTRLAPALVDHARVAAGEQAGPPTTFEVRADGKSILLKGGINDGAAEQLAEALSRAPGVTTVALSSGGGWLREGRRLAEVIRARGLHTYVEAYCASACTIAFLAGKERAAAPTARIGFHASRPVGRMGTRASPEDNRELRSLYRQANVPVAFIDKALDTSHASMWHPSHDEMLSAGILTRKSEGGETAAFATAGRTRESVVVRMKEIQMFAALAKRSPRDFDAVVNAAWAGVQRGATDAEVIVAARTELLRIVPRFIPMATDATLVDYQALIQEQLEVLRDKDATACVALLFPTERSSFAVNSLPLSLRQRELALLTRVMQEADPARVPPPSRAAMDRVVRQVTQGMTPQQLALFGSEERRRQASPAQTCEAALAFVAGGNAIRLPDRGRSLRTLYAGE